MIKNYKLFNEDKNPLSFDIDTNGNVNIYGTKYNIFELIKYYSSDINYVFATYVKRQLTYKPSEKIFTEKMFDGTTKIVNIDPNIVKFRRIVLNPSFITGLELKSIMNNTKNAADYVDNIHYIDIIDIDGNIIKTYNVKENGELK